MVSNWEDEEDISQISIYQPKDEELNRKSIVPVYHQSLVSEAVPNKDKSLKKKHIKIMKKNLKQIPKEIRDKIKTSSKSRYTPDVILTKNLKTDDKISKKVNREQAKTPILNVQQKLAVEYEEYSSRDVKKLAIKIKAAIIKIAYTIYK